ncbi:MAG: flagellar filament capping protein FliD, partial [Armatimonadetes bacterium]|nr:flagellar filament capping protein FliD [Armatimonadota bacterium]
MNIGNSAGINFSGLASGIDTESIISKLIAVENIGVQRIQQRQAQLKQRMDVFGQLRTQMSSLSSSANLLANAFSLSSTLASVANADIATITTGSNTPTGTFSLNVRKLALASKVASIAVTDSPDLNFEGNFKINDKTISVVKTDSLSDIATKINDASAGAGATVISGSDGKAYLTLTATKTGLANAVKLTEGSGDILVSLGFMTKTGGSTTSVTSMTGGSVNASSSGESLENLFGLGSAKGVPGDVSSLNENMVRLGRDPVAFRAGYAASPTQSISIDGKELTYNPRQESLDSLAKRITKELGVETQVVGSASGGFQLKASGVDTSTIKDSLGLFEGKVTTTVVPPTYGVNTASQVITAQDADFTIDGIRITSAENTNTTAIKGATITLLKADATGATSTNVSINRNYDQGKSLIKNFTDSYNALQDFLGQATQFDKESFATAPLFGDAIANQLETEIANVVSAQIPGLTGNYRSLANIGISFGEKGQISVDEAKMTAALTADPTAITKLFQPSGQITGDAITYVSSTDKTKSSATGNYAINITRAATKASVHKDIIASGLSQDGLTLGIKGGGLNSDISLQFSPGASIDSIVSTINSDDRLKDNFEAVKDAQGRLQITSKRYGA